MESAMTSATSLSPRTQTRQQLDELDALLQKMLALPGSSSESPLPPTTTAPVESIVPLASPIPGYLLGLSSNPNPSVGQSWGERTEMYLPELPALPVSSAPVSAIGFGRAAIAPRASDPAIPAFVPTVVSLPPEPARVAASVAPVRGTSWIPDGLQMLMGRAGLAMIVAAAVWATGERLGWDWTFSG